jgi:hypothetical protein
MSKLSQQLEQLLKEIETCELIASLATDPMARKANETRVEELRELAREMQETIDEAAQTGHLSDAR